LFSASSQLRSLPFSLFALGFASAKLYFSQRLGSYSDPDPTLKMISVMILINIVFLSGLLYSLIFVASYTQGYILLTIAIVTVLNGLILYPKYFKKDQRKALRGIFYPKDEKLGKKESGFVFFTAVLTSWISPSSIWANTFEKKKWFLMVSSSICITVYGLNIIVIGITEQLAFIQPTDNPPITRCFQASEVDKFNKSNKYRFFESENHAKFDIFEVCNNDHAECKPAIRICSEAENPGDELCSVLIPVGIGLLSISCIASLILQHLGNHYTFVKFLIIIRSMDTNNFVSAFDKLWKSIEINMNANQGDKVTKEKVQNELQKKMKKAAGKSTKKKRAVSEIFEIIKKEKRTEDDKNLLKTFLSLLRSETNQTIRKLIIQILDSQYSFNNFLARIGSVDTPNFAKAFIEFWKSEEMSSVDIQNELYQRMKNSLGHSFEKHNALIIIFGIITKEQITEDDEELLKKNIKIYLKSVVWNQPYLHWAVINKHYKWFSVLLLLGGQCGAKNGEDESSIDLLIKQEKAQKTLDTYNYFTKRLINRAMKTFQEFALHIAAAGGNIQEIEMLIANSYDVNKKNTNGETPLHCAFDKLPSVDTLRILIANGAKINAQNKDGKTPLHLAFEKRDLECFKYLLDNGADVKAKDDKGRTPLHYASEDNQLEFVKALVESDASGLLEEDNQGMTALHLAAKKGHKDCLIYLTEKTEDVSFQDDHGWDLLTKFANNYA
jgi:ankyrin repeat protein